MGHCPLRFLPDRLGGFCGFSEGVKFLTKVVALPFGLFAPAPLFCEFLP